MSYEKRLILAISLSVVILVVFNLLFVKPPVRVEPETEIFKEKEEEVVARVVPKEPALLIPQEAELKIKEEDLLIETESSLVGLTPNGEIKSLRLKRFKEGREELVDMTKDFSRPPLRLTVDGKTLAATGFSFLNNYGREFTYDLKDVRIAKEILFSPSSYTARINLKIKNEAGRPLSLKDLALCWGPQTIDAKGSGRMSSPPQSYFKDGDVKNVSHKGIGFLERAMVFLGLAEKREIKDQQEEVEGNLLWVAQGERYFLSLLALESNFKKAIFTKSKTEELGMDILLSDLLLDPGEEKLISLKLYAGPREYESLKEVATNSTKLTGLGSISLFMLKLLNFFYSICGNFGLAIIILTIMVKIVLYPLSHKSLKSMKQMQDLAPKITALKKKYGKDMMKLQQETSQLYKRHKVNPLGGCLPMLLQLPIFFALYGVFMKAIELRGAPFFLWINDLSVKDPFYVLPVLMGATMFLQQKMTPTSADPAQAKMMMFMPIILTFMFLQFPSGLVLYWLAQNVLSIGQQMVFNKISKK